MGAVAKIKALLGGVAENEFLRGLPALLESVRRKKQLTFKEKLALLRVQQILVLVAVLVVVAIPPVFVSHPIGYLPLVTYVFTVLISGAYLWVVQRGFVVENSIEQGTCARGTTMSLPVVMRNDSVLPALRISPQFYVTNPYGKLEFEAPSTSIIGARDEEVINANVVLGHVGTYAAGLHGVILFDPLMLFHSFVDCSNRAEIVATPNSFTIESVEFSRLALQESHAPIRTILSDDVDYAGTRDYEFGDPLKSVHWKLSARTPNLQTRLFETNVNTRTAILMDFHSPDYDVDTLLSCNDVIIELALATGRLALSKNMETHLHYVSRGGVPVVTDIPRESAVDALVADLPLPSPDVRQDGAIGLLEREVKAANGSDNVVFCTSSLTRDAVAAFVAARASRVSVSVLLAMPRDLVRGFYKSNQGLMAELESAGIPCIVLSDVAELEEFDRVG